MAKRITVVVSQSAQRDAAAVDLEEKLVAELMMTSGLDATLVGPLESIEAGSTDYLCLSSLPRSFAVVSWLEYPQVVEHWRRLDLKGVLQQLGVVNQPTPSGVATGIYLPLAQKAEISEVVFELKRLQQTPDVQTFGIALPVAGKPATTIKRDPPGKPQLPVLPVTGSGPQTSFQSSAAEELDLEDEEFDDLDQLVDDLDNFDF